MSRADDVGEPEESPIRFTDNRKVDRERAEQTEQAGGADTSPAGAGDPLAHTGESDVAMVEAVLLEERTRDLQRVQAEYANYRKRAERDRLAAGDAAIARAAGDFLPVLDDLDRARAHGDLSGALKSIADKLDDVFARLGLESFGEVGDAFDPAVHEAVMHDVSDAVSVPTATTVMRRGYRHRERLVRPAMVGVSDPAGPSGEAMVDDSAPDLAMDDAAQSQDPPAAE